MLLERRIVCKLQDFNYTHGDTRSLMEDFVGDLANSKWPRLNFFLSKGEFAAKVVRVLNDCIERGYITLGEGGAIWVNKNGRELISRTGFCEEYLKRRKRFSGIVKAVLLSSTVTGLVVHFWPLLMKQFQ